MLARTHTFTLDGFDAGHVIVEADVRGGLPALAIIGLTGASARDVRERVRGAILNSGYRLPPRRTTISLLPPGAGGHGLDLAVACAILAASGQIARERLSDHALLGGLSLDGTVHGVPGTVAAAEAARGRGLAAIVTAGTRCAEAGLVDGLEVLAADSLRATARVLAGGRPDPRPRGGTGQPPLHTRTDLATVRGQRQAVRALVIAAAGGHNLLLCGPPGSGRTTLARRLPGLLPPPAGEEAREIAQVASLAGAAVGAAPVRPFLAPHHTVTPAGLLGGGGGGLLGAAVLAHGGILFLDDLAAFDRRALGALRQPLENRCVVVESRRRRYAYPARFQLLATASPCPCGLAGERVRCRCGEGELARYASRVEPVLARIDLASALERDGVAADGEPVTSAAAAAEAVALARERQRARLRDEPVSLNSALDTAILRRHAGLDRPAEELLARARAAGLLSVPGRDRAIRVARTIADLDGRVRVGERDIGAALALRPEPALAWRRS